MGKKCFTCEELCVAKNETVKCRECNESFHMKCTSVGSPEKWLKLKRKEKTAWKCDRCTTEQEGEEDCEDPEDTSLIDAINKMDKNLCEKMDSKFDAIEKSINSINDKVSSLQTDIKSVSEDLATVKSDYNGLISENKRLSDALCKVQVEMDELQQRSRINNIEVSGVPVTTGENVYEILNRISAVLGVTFNRSDFSTAHRIHSFDTRRHPAIIAQFISRSTRSEWLMAARQIRGMQTKDIYPSLKEGVVYINEHITASNKILLGKARQRIKEKTLAYAWVRDGKIFVRRDPNSSAVLIRCEDDIVEATKYIPTLSNM